MKTTFYFVRHGETETKKQGIVQGTGISIPLNERGHLQAAALASALESQTFDAIYTSCCQRAIDTAAPFRQQFPMVPYAEREAFNERSKGVAEGMTKAAFREAYPDIEAQWEQGGDPRPVGGESFEDVELRVMPEIEKHLEQHAGGSVMIISHGNINRVILGALLGMAHGDRGRLEQSYCAVNIATYDHDRKRWSVECVNNVPTSVSQL